MKTFFTDQAQQLRSFMASPECSLRVVQIEPDLEPLLKRLLVGIDEDDGSPFVLVSAATSFQGADQFFTDLLSELQRQNEAHRDALAAAGVDLPQPRPEPDLPSSVRLSTYVSDVADAVRRHLDSYVVVIHPKEVQDRASFREAILHLALTARSRWAKYLVLDNRSDPALPDIDAAAERASIQLFHFSPSDIEARIAAELAGGRLGPPESRQYAAMLASFAFSRRDYARAEAIQYDLLAQAGRDGTPEEQANTLYNLGNTYLQQQKPELAEDCFTRAVEICAEARMHPLLGILLCQLGVALLRQDRLSECLESFDTARRTFRALRHPPGEAYVLDGKAAALAAAGEHDKAELAWFEALAVYDRITAPSFRKLRQTGRDDILEKLRRFYEATDQSAKVARLPSTPS